MSKKNYFDRYKKRYSLDVAETILKTKSYIDLVTYIYVQTELEVLECEEICNSIIMKLNNRLKT